MTGTPPPMIWESAFISHTGSVRAVNEDAFLEAPDIGLWAVADGMGGHEEGGLASRMVIDALDALPEPKDLASFVNSVRSVLVAVNQRLRDLAASYAQRVMIGTTVAVLLAMENTAVALWAGDSRIYLRRQRRLVRLTKDHSRFEELAVGDAPGGRNTPRRTRQYLTRAVGAQDEIVLDTITIEVQAGDEFLLCSDGLNKSISDEELASLLKNGTCDETVRGLLDLCLSRKASDNVTAGLVRVSDRLRT